MLSRHRRFFAVAAFLLLAAPLAVGLVWQDDPQLIYREGRRLAPVPDPPTSLAGLAALPGQIDAYLSDHFGLRHAMIKLHRDLSHPVVMKVNTAAMIGRDGRMFLLRDDAVKQSAGIVLRDQRVGETADLLVRMRDALASHGIRFLVASPPNASTIYQEDLPLWAQSRGRQTEYDLFLADLAERGVTTVDLRPPLIRLKSEAPAYLKHDTHWTPRGALAGFNAIVAADDHPDWRLDPALALGPPTTRNGGDLVRMLGWEDSVNEPVQDLALTDGDRVELSAPPFGTYVETSNKPGPTIMIIGDSFTQGLFAPMLMKHVSKVVWLHHDFCAFDWTLIDKFWPDEVWWLPTERSLICSPGAHPAGFAGYRAQE